MAGDGAVTSGPERSPMAAAGQLAVSLDALAALAAHLRVELEGLEVEPACRELLAAIASDVVGDTAALPEEAKRAIVGMVRAFVHQAGDLVDNPGRAAGWADTDERLLQSIGQLSMGVVDAVVAAGRLHPALGELLDTEGSVFVDVGTGTGWLAIAMARADPRLRVVGLDIFEPALDLARRNVAEVGLAERIELRLHDAGAAVVEPADAIWLPVPFLPGPVVDEVLGAMVASLRPGGWVLAGTFPGPGETLGERLMMLRTLRAGGHPWEPEALLAKLAAAGLGDVGEVPVTWPAPVRLYVGRAPSAG